MLFTSIHFALFLPIVFLLYWLATKNDLKLQNILLFVSSCFFYACWDWRFLSLLLVSIILIYYPGHFLSIAKRQKTRQLWLWLSIVFSVGFLGIFKYYNFFVNSFADMMSNFGLQINPFSLNLVLPVGISFYTFHGLSYIIDLYNRKISEEKNFVNYAVFVSFFPLLIAGPIERATHLLPQITAPRTFDYNKVLDGLRQILWGLFKKIVIADNCAVYANMIFNDSADYSGSSLFLGAVFFAFQIYGDFSGYSDIALGAARLFGIELLRNFAFPYFSRDIAEFWRRWHISLTTWFRDYLYIPLGGSRGGTLIKIRNTFIIFLVSGFWHGANWTFIAWGALNALYFLPLLLTNKNRNNLGIVAQGKCLPTIMEVFRMGLTFSLTVFAWILFRANNIQHAEMYMAKILSPSLFTIPQFTNMGGALRTIILIGIFVLIEWQGRECQYGVENLNKIKSKALKTVLVYLIAITIITFGNFGGNPFIYFQF